MKLTEKQIRTRIHFNQYCDEGGDPLEYAYTFKVPHRVVDELREKRMKSVLRPLQSLLGIDVVDDDWLPILLPPPKKWSNPEEKEEFIRNLKAVSL
ncbi:MAG: hypothetical protein KAR00_00940 [Candidatus Pacebacteria bacterium]|nr:hypothetical protein [Candidatus Paceibacterota bacterium]